MKKAIKAKDAYGPVLERVKNNNILKVQHQNDNVDPPPPGGITIYSFFYFFSHFKTQNNET